MLVRLYALPEATPVDAAAPKIRKPIGAEAQVVINWVRQQFGDAWAAEARMALGNRPISLFVAVEGPQLLGFACYDATARGFFGPIGVAAAERGQGTGARLLHACLDDMRSVGYGYAVIGAAGPGEFFQRSVGAVEIADSTPGIYRDMLKADPPISSD